MKIIYQFILLSALISIFACKSKEEKRENLIQKTDKAIQLGWQQLFNGKNLSGWIPKIRHHEVGKNYENTFSVQNGYITVNYDGYHDVFNKQYGHLFYNNPFSAYFLAIEYRFIGSQIADGEGWAYRNSGVMLHGQAPETMLKDQDFPISIEGQFLGGDPNTNEERPTLNLCTPGTNVILNDSIYTPHCINSTSKTYRGDQWVRGTFLVLKDSIIKHLIEGEIVMEYTHPQVGNGNVENFNPSIKQNGKALTEGYISIQSESHPVEFRKIEIIDLNPIYKNKEKLNATINTILKEEKNKKIQQNL